MISLNWLRHEQYGTETCFLVKFIFGPNNGGFFPEQNINVVRFFLFNNRTLGETAELLSN